MKVLSIFIMLSFLSILGLQAQIKRLVSMNQNGKVEYLFYDYEQYQFEYATGNTTQRTKLITLKRKADQYFEVRFPNSPKVYILRNQCSHLECQNPDGSRQDFIPEGKYVSIGKSGLKEYLYFVGEEATAYYASSRQPKRIKLQTLHVYLEEGITIVRFPNAPARYKLQYLDNGNLICYNPDGSQQTFRPALY